MAARNIQECLLLQLKRDPLPDPVSVEIIEVHFEDLSRRRYPDIARAMKLALDRIMESVEEIMALEPKPGRRFGGNDSRYIVPDVYVYKLGSDYTIVLNEDGVPRLRVNSLYRSLLRNSGVDEARQYVEQKLRSALWLIKSVDQRQRTLAKGHAVDRQVPARLPRPRACPTCDRCPCGTSARTSACTSRRSAA